MRKEVSEEYNVFCKAAGKTIHWKVSIKKTDDMSELHSEGTWIDVTPYLQKDTPDNIGCKTEVSYGQFQSDQLKMVGLDIAWWKSNIFSYANQLELKIEFWINDLTDDTIVVFAGWVDKLKDSFVLKSDARKNTIVFTINAYAEYAERLSANRLCSQIINENVDGAETHGIVLTKISGVFVLDANISGYVLKKGIHTISYDYNSGTEQCKLDDGEWVELSGSAGAVTLINAVGDEKIQIYFKNATLLTGTSVQKVIVLIAGDTLPYTWYNYQFIFYLLKKFFLLVGITEYSFDDFKINTRDGRWTSSFYEIPSGDAYYSTPQTVYWDETNTRLWLGIGDKIFTRNMTTHLYTEVGQLPSSSGYSIERFFPEKISSGELWGVAVKWGSGTHLFCVTISTGAISVYALAHHVLHEAQWKTRSIGFSPGFGTAGAFFYFSELVNTHLWYFDLSTLAEVDAYTAPYTIHSRIAFCVGNSFYYFRRYASDDSGGFALEHMYYSGGVWNTAVGLVTDQITECVYSPSLGMAYGSCLVNNHLFSFNPAGGPFNNGVYTEFGTHRGKNFEVRGSIIYYQVDATSTPSRIVAGSISAFTGDDLTIPPGDSMIGPFKMTVDVTNERILMLFNQSGLLGQYSPKLSMFIEEEADGEGKTLIDMMKELCIGFNLRPRISTTKECHILRRADENGVIITSGESIELNADRARDLTEECGTEGGADIVSVKNATDETNYDGTNYDVVPLDNERIQPFQNIYIPTRLLKDYAYCFYQYFKNVLTRYAVPTPLIPFFQYEPFDGADLNFSGNINTLVESVPKSGIILGQTISRTGATEFEVMV